MSTKNPYKYGSMEYKLHGIGQEVEAIQSDLAKFRTINGNIINFESIGFGGDWLKTSRIEAKVNYGNQLDRMISWGNWTSFNKDRKDHIEQCYKAALEYFDKAMAEVEKWHVENLPHIANNLEVKKSIEAFMTLVGIPTTYTTSEFKTKRSTKRETVTHRAGYLQDIDRSCKISDNYEGAKSQLNRFKAEAEEWKKKHLAGIAQKAAELEKSDERIRLVAKAMELAAKYEIANDQWKTNDELISLVTERAREEYLEEAYEEGYEFNIKCCDSCSAWVYGEHRCRCSSRRMSLTTEGDILNGFSSYPEAY